MPDNSTSNQTLQKGLPPRVPSPAPPPPPPKPTEQKKG